VSESVERLVSHALPGSPEFTDGGQETGRPEGDMRRTGGLLGTLVRSSYAAQQSASPGNREVVMQQVFEREDPRQPTWAPPALLSETPFAVVDVETTGFSPLNGDRIVEVAVVRLDGASTEEYSTLVNPLRDVGPSHIHGLIAEDVAQAPLFTEVVGDLLEMMSGAVMVAHNVRYDRDFLAAEVSATGVFLPAIPSLCTLELSYRLDPGLENHRLATCCFAAGVPFSGEHSALADARAEASLLRKYLAKAEAAGLETLDALGSVPSQFPTEFWPHLERSGRSVVRTGDGARGDLPYLARLVASLDTPSVSEKVGCYVDLLDRALEDQQVAGDEAQALATTAREWGLSREDVLAAHQAYLEALIATAVQDGRVTGGERRELEAVTRLLAIDPSMMHALLARAMEDPG
jgi:DNA polymerase III epsilon subunit-like protein